MSNKHKHVEMICAKADNMDLISFFKNNAGEWIKKGIQSNTLFNVGYKYFLCLPKHEEACLHWLNGGVVQFESVGDYDWADIKRIGACAWSESTVFMSYGYNTRIKPKKVKRWVIYNKDLGYFTPNGTFLTEEDARENASGHWSVDDRLQFIEIWVEE